MKSILIVEDNTDLALALQRNLEHEGHRGIVAPDATRALEVAMRDAPDLVVLDLGLPERSGFLVLKQLRERGSEVPVLLLSDQCLQSDSIEGFRCGSDDYVTKPFGVVELMTLIALHLRQDSTNGDAPDPAILCDEVLRERYELTQRQVDVARLLARGLSNAEIADTLQMSAYTARSYTEHVLFKLGAATRARVGAILRGSER